LRAHVEVADELLPQVGVTACFALFPRIRRDFELFPPWLPGFALLSEPDHWRNVRGWGPVRKADARFPLFGLPATFAPVSVSHMGPFSRAAHMDWLLRDLRHGARGYVRRPVFTLIVVATIALGVGANAAIFSVVSGILLRPLPYPHAEQVFSFGHEAPEWL